MIAIKLGVILMGALFLVTACQSTPSNTTNSTAAANAASQDSPKQSPTPDVIAEGKEIFATNCMICHKEDGTGGPVTIAGKKIDPDNLTTEKMKMMPDEKLIGYVTNGVVDEGMPAFKGKLTDDEIKLAVAHVRRLQGP